MKWTAIALACMAVLHTPDGLEFRADINHIGAVRPAEQHTAQGHIAAGIHSLVYVDGKPWGIIESVEQVQSAIHNCIDGQR